MILCMISAGPNHVDIQFIHLYIIIIYIYTYQVGGLEHKFYFFHILGIIIPTDSIFFRGVGQAPTRYNSVYIWLACPGKDLWKEARPLMRVKPKSLLNNLASWLVKLYHKYLEMNW
jgi:hypothetical protein